LAEQVLIVGAGIVGICCGIALAEAGYGAVLIDPDLPGRAASRWNAGVLSTSSLVPFNRPGLALQLPRLLLGRSPGFRLAARATGRVLPWGLRYLAATRASVFTATVGALDSLICLSMGEHRRLMSDSRSEGLLSDAGWIVLYETAAEKAASAGLLEILTRHGVGHQRLDREALGALEPYLAPRFEGGLWLTGTAAVRDPARALAAYLDRFRALGGRVERARVARLEGGDGPAAILESGERRPADHVVIAAGPGSTALVATLGRRLPMVSERGYVRRFALRGGARLHRPVYDVAGGLVLAPRPEGVQLSTGTELTLPHLPPLDRQREAAARRAAELLPLGPALEGFDGVADRPTLPDSRPAIGRMAGVGPIWLCCGHQHIGFSTAPGSARLLAALMRGGEAPLEPRPFSPARFGL
jgi:D-amino-acid dehydrogenase